MIALDQARTLQGRTLYGPGHEEIGTIDALYADRDGGEPTSATVHTGLFGTRTHVVPLARAELMEDHVMTEQVRKEQVEADGVYPDGGSRAAGRVSGSDSELTVEPRR